MPHRFENPWPHPLHCITDILRWKLGLTPMESTWPAPEKLPQLSAGRWNYASCLLDCHEIYRANVLRAREWRENQPRGNTAHCMKFKLTKARRHPLQGLEVTDEFGVAYLTHTKRSVLEAAHLRPPNFKGLKLRPHIARVFSAVVDLLISRV